MQLWSKFYTCYELETLYNFVKLIRTSNFNFPEVIKKSSSSFFLFFKMCESCGKVTKWFTTWIPIANFEILDVRFVNHLQFLRTSMHFTFTDYRLWLSSVSLLLRRSSLWTWLWLKSHQKQRLLHFFNNENSTLISSKKS